MIAANQESVDDWARMYRSLTDPEEREQSKRAANRLKRKHDRMADTGL